MEALPEDLQPYVCFSKAVIEEAFRRYSPERIFLAFNGGKDCSVVLYILIRILHRNVAVVYFQGEDDFEAVKEHVRALSFSEKLQIRILEMGVKEGTQLLVEEGYEACFLGQRRRDPSSPTSEFMKSTPSWPPIMRVFPILNWEVEQVWQFLRVLEVPVCNLYLHGFTSLGPRSSTSVNPKLGDRPAWELRDSASEREGRRDEPTY